MELLKRRRLQAPMNCAGAVDNDNKRSVFPIVHLRPLRSMVLAGSVHKMERDRARSFDRETMMKLPSGCQRIRSKAGIRVIEFDQAQRRALVHDRRIDQGRAAPGQ